MSLISLRQRLDHAAENNYGVPAFNVNNLEAIRAIMEGAKELNSPVILQASGAARKYAGPIFVKKLVVFLIAITWKWYYYAPNTYKYYCLNRMKTQNNEKYISISENVKGVTFTMFFFILRYKQWMKGFFSYVLLFL